MTRKCALCKGTNYKRTYSFFSAPKDPEIRKKWQASIPIPNYTVTDDTYICSKHFRSSDIITHWVSGVPPNVITIKYKKCRLRIGAVPCLNFEDDDNAQEPVIDDDFGRGEELIGNGIDFLIPREKDTGSIAIATLVTELDYNNSNGTIQPPIKLVKCNVVGDQSNANFSRIEYVDVSSSHETYVSSDEQMQDSVNSDKEFDESKNYFDYEYPQIHKVESRASIINDESQETSDNDRHEKSQDARGRCGVYPKVTSCNVKLEQDEEILTEELSMEEDDSRSLRTERIGDNEERNRDDGSEGNRNIVERRELGDNLLKALQYNTENKSVGENPDSELCDTMLFEDLLEIYTEVTLPRGWAFLVTSKGHTTTVVYLYMNIPTNHIPVVEKEVFIKSDMVMHCGVGSREINPFIHNLIKDGRNNKVHALSDIEELIDELDQRQICEGGPNVKNFTDVEMQHAYVDGTKWRHVGCPIIVNNGSSKCSKCVSLNSIVGRRKDRNARRASLDILRGQQKQIATLTKSLKKITRCNQRLEGIRLRFRHRLRLLSASAEKTIKNRISSSNMPAIQKLMIKECLKASVFKSQTNVRYSETWIFLCLLLYVESPRMYRYMFVNNYMTLPSMGTIRKYLNRIKTDPQFYNLFQRSVEPYQPITEQNEEEPT